jgi:hypothetical protein
VHEGGRALVRLADGSIAVRAPHNIPPDAVRLDSEARPP